MGKWTGQDNSNELNLEWIGPVVTELQHMQGSKSTYHAHLIARLMGPTWGPSGADRTQVGPMLAPRTLLSGFQWTWFGVKWPSDCWVLASSRFQKPLLCPWACPCCPMGKWTGQDNSNELNLEWIGPVVTELQHMQGSKSTYHAHRHTNVALMGKWP